MATQTPKLDLTKPDYRATRYDIPTNENWDKVDAIHGYVVGADKVLRTTTQGRDVFVYDTTKDSDGGAWRKRCQHLSWYNEPLDTATRGATREFPAVVLVVVEQHGLILYDLTDPLCPMWMVFYSLSYGYVPTGQLVSCSSINGRFIVTTGNQGCGIFDFIQDRSIASYMKDQHDNNYYVDLPLEGRNNTDSAHRILDNNIPSIVNNYISDSCITILEQAPIDPVTQLPVPTIAVATDGGVSVIDGPAGIDTVVDITCSDGIICNGLNFRHSDNALLFGFGIYANGINLSLHVLHTVPSVDTVVAPHYYQKGLADEFYYPASTGSTQTSDLFLMYVNYPTCVSKNGDTGGVEGLTNLKAVPLEPEKGMVNYLTDEWLSGWMQGDIKLATLADGTEETIGLDVFTEHVVNGNFDTDLTGWTDASTGSGSISWNSGGYVDITGVDASNRGFMTQHFTFVTGTVYTVSINLVTNNAGSQLRVVADVPLLDIFPLPAGVSTFTFKATREDTVLQINVYGNGTNTFDDISIKAVSNKIENGEFSSDRAWTLDPGTGGVITISGGQADIDNGGNTTPAFISQDVLTVGKHYKVTVDADSYVVAWGVTIGSTYHAINAAGITVIMGIADTSTIAFGVPSVSSHRQVVLNNVIVEEMTVPDRSINNTPLNVTGLIEKTPVAEGSDLVAYSGFSADNYISQPHNPALDFGTGDFYVMGWVTKGSTGGTFLHLCEKGDTYNQGSIYIELNTDMSKLTAVVGASSVLADTQSDTFMFSLVRTSGDVLLYVQGRLEDTNNVPTDISNSNNNLFIGVRGDLVQHHGGSISLIRIGAGAPSPDQIKEIYQSELALFQHGAKFKLPSKNVISLATDETTNELLVGTDAGAVKYNGLLNIKDILIDGQTNQNIKALSTKKGIIGLVNDAEYGVIIPELNIREECYDTPDIEDLRRDVDLLNDEMDALQHDLSIAQTRLEDLEDKVPFGPFYKYITVKDFTVTADHPTYQLLNKLDVVGAEAGLYEIKVVLRYTISTTNRSAYFRWSVDGGVTWFESVHESKDVTDKNVLFYAWPQQITAGDIHFAIEVAKETSSISMEVERSDIVIERKL